MPRNPGSRHAEPTAGSPWRRARVAAIILAAALIPVLLWQIHGLSERLLLDRLGQQNRQLVELYAESLRGTLNRYRPIPRVLAQHPAIAALLGSATDPDAMQAANLLFEHVNDTIGADEIYLMDASGLTLAASNWQAQDSFVGKNFAFRPYFRDAQQGRLGRYHALGTTSGRRGYYFASPVRGTSRVEGVVVVKVDIESVEKSWGNERHAVMVTDGDGVIFMASRPGWIYRTLESLSDDRLAELRASRRYADRAIEPLPGFAAEQATGHGQLVALPRGDGPAVRQALAVSLKMADIGWTMRVLADTAAVRGQSIVATIVAGAVLLVLALLALWLTERRRRLRHRLALRDREQVILAQAAAELEDRVHERTAELEIANARLRSEITERLKAEDGLRRSQEDLVQAGKLAALGQLASGVSHELSQPLTAIRTYADNARVLLERNHGDEAAGNLATISELVERTARIIDHLRVFARKTPLQAGPVPVAATVRRAVDLLRDIGRLDGIELDMRLPDESPVAVAEPVRLEQVLLNLLQNAADALDGAERRRISVRVEEDADGIALRVADSGPGIAEENLPHVFEPFFTTKEVGKGTGLGLSISYGIAEALGGSLRAANSPDGGAEFTLRLRCAAPDPAREETALG